jgi:hypothetical protein
MEVGSSCAETLQVDVERLSGYEVGTAGAIELQTSLDGAVPDGSLGVC